MAKRPDPETSEREARRRAERQAQREARRRRVAEGEAPSHVALPDLPLLVPAAAGALLAGYLAFVAWSGVGPAACGPGSGCDVVQASRYAVLLGLPTAAWGFFAYLALVGVAVSVRSARLHAGAALAIAGSGLVVSLWLTAVSVFELGATCVWCLASLALMAVCFGVAWWRRPRPPARTLPAAFLPAVAAVSVLAVGGLHLHFQGAFDPAKGPADPGLRGLALHLDEIGARFYGASWCPHCQHQKDAFGGAADLLPYVECAVEGAPRRQAEACREAQVEAYPTWVIHGEQHTGLLPVEELAQLSGYEGPLPGGRGEAPDADPHAGHSH